MVCYGRPAEPHRRNALHNKHDLAKQLVGRSRYSRLVSFYATFNYGILPFMGSKMVFKRECGLSFDNVTWKLESITNQG